MRTDCTRDNRKTYLPNASHLGFNLWHAKRGNWIVYREHDSDTRCARVLGRVRADGKTYVEVIAALGAFDIPAVRWIEPESILQCRATPPANIFAFFAGDWSSPSDILAKVSYGFPH